MTGAEGQTNGVRLRGGVAHPADATLLSYHHLEPVYLFLLRVCNSMKNKRIKDENVCQLPSDDSISCEQYFLKKKRREIPFQVQRVPGVKVIDFVINL